MLCAINGPRAAIVQAAPHGYGAPMQAAALLEAPWREPITVLAAFADEPWAFGLVGRGSDARWAYLGRRPDATLVLDADNPHDPFAEIAALVGDPRPHLAEGPPFQAGVVGLAAYELGDRVEPLGLQRLDSWPDLACARYPAILAFDQAARRLWAVGRGVDEAEARERAREALGWLEGFPPGDDARAEIAADDPAAYEQRVAEIVARIAAGEIFQANLARRWRGRLAQGASPFGVFARLHANSPAPYAAWLRLPGRALASNSPEQFLEVKPVGGRLQAVSRPIKGTAPRSAEPAADRAYAEALAASPKDRAENLMIVDLMRNDLSRVCEPGTVEVPELCAVETFANVHHLVSTVRGTLSPGRTAVDLLRAAFPPGSITGAPKIQAMRVIAGLEAPRGPFFGSILRLGFDGSLDSSVLIRTAAFVEDERGWQVEARAGAGIVADSTPAAERAETEAKIAALVAALTSSRSCAAGRAAAFSSTGGREAASAASTRLTAGRNSGGQVLAQAAARAFRASRSARARCA
jgi:para-aminobenzoate synthetase component 1